jgi:hypothetical protein
LAIQPIANRFEQLIVMSLLEEADATAYSLATPALAESPAESPNRERRSAGGRTKHEYDDLA